MAGRRERARRGGFPTKAAATEARNALLSRSREESTTVLWSVGKWLRFWLPTRTSIVPVHDIKRRERLGPRQDMPGRT